MNLSKLTQLLKTPDLVREVLGFFTRVPGEVIAPTNDGDAPLLVIDTLDHMPGYFYVVTAPEAAGFDLGTPRVYFCPRSQKGQQDLVERALRAGTSQDEGVNSRLNKALRNLGYNAHAVGAFFTD